MRGLLVLLVLSASPVWAQTISGVSGTLTQGSTITLTAPTNAGVTVPAPCATDRNGVTLSATPGRGALQFTVTGPARLRRTPDIAGLATFLPAGGSVMRRLLGVGPGTQH